MIDYEKAQHILYVLPRKNLSRAVVLLQPETVIEKCRSSKELDFYYNKLCKGRSEKW
ncbi:MAG: hypothetical protein NC093_09155 [Alistipes sp.]|nr:hypothetical protein [Alistipes sp.]